MLRSVLHSFKFIGVMGAVLVLGGCEMKQGWNLPEFTSLGTKERADWTHIRRANYAAADVLFQRAGKKLDRFHRVELIRLNNLGEPLAEGVAPIEWLVPQQVGNRLAILGLKVDQPKKAPMNAADKRADGTLPMQLFDQGYVKPVVTKREYGHLYVEGDYAYLEDELLVSLQLVDGTKNLILSSVEYDMKVDPNLFMLLNPMENDRLFDSGWMY